MPARKNLEADVTDFAQALGLLVRRVRAESAVQTLSLTEASVIRRLVNDGPATTADLARAERVKPQSMGTIVAALEELELVERKPHPTDGRQLYIQITAKGLAFRKSVLDAKGAWLTKTIKQLDEKEQEVLFRAGEIIKRLANS